MLIEEKISSLLTAITGLLKTEKGLLQQKLAELSQRMQNAPEKWRRESLLEFQKELSVRGIEMMSEIVESKNIAHHFYEGKMKPLDPAIPPTAPFPKRFFSLSLLAAFFGGLSCYGYQLIRGVSRGLPLSLETLRYLGFPVIGSLSPDSSSSLSEFGREDLETLRSLSESVLHRKREGRGEIVALIGGKYVNYTKPLAELLSLQGVKVLLVHALFDAVVHPREIPGLWQYLNGEEEEISIRSQGKFDWISSGGTSRHGIELLRHQRFNQLLEQCQQKYDLVLLYTCSSVGGSGAKTLIAAADKVVLSIQQESKGDLSYLKEIGRKEISLIYCEGER